MSKGTSLNLSVSYDKIQVLSPYSVIRLNELNIINKINDHARIYLAGIIDHDGKDSCIADAGLKDMIEVNQMDENSGVINLFKGLVTDITIKVVAGVYYLELKGASFTYDMDLKLRKRSFQNKDMPYTELIRKVIGNYKKADFIDTASNNENIEKFIIQYNETDWEFLKRMASHFNTGLIPQTSLDKPGFWFGIPNGTGQGSLEEFNYSVSKNIDAFKFSSSNYIGDFEETDLVNYTVETDRLMKIGDKLSFKDINLVVLQSVSSIKNGILKHEYILAPEKGSRQNFILNSYVFRNSIEGKVIDINEDNLRLHLEIDNEQEKEEAWWFPYSTFYTTEGQTGWYCMPELGDCVKLYFPTNKEEEGIIIDSIRRRLGSGDKINNPDVKYFRTKYGKEEMFSEKELLISGKDNKILIRLNDDFGVEFYSETSVKIISGYDIIMNAKTVNIEAGKVIELICNASRIFADGTTRLNGKSVKARCK